MSRFGKADLLQLARFLATGALNAAFGYGMFAACIWVGLPPALAVAVSTVLGVLFNYQTTRRLVFRAQGRLLRFCGIYAILYVANVLLLKLLMDVFRLSAYLGNALLLLPMALASYLALRRFVFAAAAARGGKAGEKPDPNTLD